MTTDSVPEPLAEAVVEAMENRIEPGWVPPVITEDDYQVPLHPSSAALVAADDLSRALDPLIEAWTALYLRLPMNARPTQLQEAVLIAQLRYERARRA